jgi:hypothetical protein
VPTDYIGSPAESVPSSAERDLFRNGEVCSSELRRRLGRPSDCRMGRRVEASSSAAESEAARSPAPLTAEASDEELAQPESPSPPDSGSPSPKAPNRVEGINSRSSSFFRLTVLAPAVSNVDLSRSADRRSQ